ncbi:MAG: AmmeMemoRadiSam system protein B [Elusimicrobia bacterium]|nr:AmmeMemoRadiSam system protein B [Elusimicrobiota bacterium]
METRKPAVAGSFYEADPEKLKKTVSQYLDCGPAKTEGEIIGVLAPHAGYVYSGAMAGRAFARLKEIKADTFVIIGTGHTMALERGALMAGGLFETPLGPVPVDTKLAAELMKTPSLFENLPEAHETEHSIEVQLPFLQVLNSGDFKILPLLFNTENADTLVKAGKALAACLKGRKAVICVSSDLSHYPPGDVAAVSDKSIMLSLQTALRNADPGYFDLACRLALEKNRSKMDTAACGQAAIIAGAAAALELGGDDFDLAGYSHSGMTSGDDNNVVGYAAGVFSKTGKKKPGAIALNAEIKLELLAQARKSIGDYLKNNRITPLPMSERLEFNQPAAVFVTLTENGRLRGCIGSMEPRAALADAVNFYAVAAAFEDSRFSPVTRNELPKIKIEISVLSPLKPVASYAEVEPRRHGVYVQKGSRSGTYLPQVWEHFKTRDEFLSSLCLEKAGLDANAWKEKSTALYVYTVDSFEEGL